MVLQMEVQLLLQAVGSLHIIIIGTVKTRYNYLRELTIIQLQMLIVVLIQIPYLFTTL